MRKRWMKRFIQYYLRRECLERLAGDKRLVSEVFDEWRRSVSLHLEYDRKRRDDLRTEYWKGYSEALGWLLKVK